MTLLEVLTAATDYLHKAGVPEARLNAEHLLAHALGKKKRLDLYMEFDRPLGESERAPLRNLVRARSQGTPLQHVMGSAAFFGREFNSDPRALIPRPETEQLVELSLKLLGKDVCTIPSTILDCGTGSGVIAITLALEVPTANLCATDVSPDALALAAENATRHAVLNRIQFIEADLIPPNHEPFDLVIANLPYIPSPEIPTLAREVQHDPVLALDGGPDGLDLIRRLLATTPTQLNPNGHIALEIGLGQAEIVGDLCKNHNFRDITAHHDYQNRLRFITARHG